MEVEQRKEKRTTTSHLSVNELFHAVSDRYFTVKSVRDVSIEGIGLNVGADLKRGEKVRLECNYPGRTRFQIYGRVAWCAPLADDDVPGLFMMGLSL